MINLDDIRGHLAIEKLGKYSGKNPYIKRLKKKLLKQGKIRLTDTQSNYIIDNFDKEPMLINKIVRITEYLGEQLKEKEDLSFTPERILIEFMLADSEKTYHIYGKLKRNQKQSKMYFIPKTQVMGDPYFEELDIDVDFEKYEKMDQFVLSDGTVGRKLYDLQKVGIKFLLSRNGCILADDMGTGKAEFVENKVFTPLGRKRIGDIVPGDFVIGSDGSPTVVEGVYPQGIKDLYRVTFNDDYSVLVCKEHLFTVTSNNGSTNNKNRAVRHTTLSVEQMLDKELRLEQRGTGWNQKRLYNFKTYYKQSNGQNKWQIPIVKPIVFSRFYDEYLPIEPYLLGVSLGDGCILENNVQFTSHKDDFDEIFNGYMIKENKPTGDVRRCTINLGESIKELNLENTRSDTKFIPDIYKYSSIENRLNILQGLMDTDGYCCKSKKGEFKGTEFCTVSEQLADDVAEIVHSLGGIVRKKSKIGSYKKEDGTRVICKKAYRLNIKLPEGMNPFRLSRKAEQYKTPKKYKVGRYIKDIQLEKQGEAVCIKVSAPDSLYVTEHGIVTHNTLMSIIAALESGAKNILIVCPSGVKINWEREIHYLQCYDTTIIDSREWKQAKFTIINYDILKNFHALPSEDLKAKDIALGNQHMVNAKFDLCIIDEAHKLKNHKSKRGAIMTELCVKHGIEKVWLLTGTPIANRPMDFYNLLKLIKAPVVDNWKFFAQRYCDGKRITTRLKNGRTKQVWLTSGASNLEELSIKTRNLIIKRMKEEFGDMPDKIITTQLHKLSEEQWSEYNNLWEEYLEERARKKKRGEPDRDLVELGLLRRFIANQAIPYTIEMANNIIEQGQKVIIFTNYTDELLELADYFGKECVTHYGKMTDKEKQRSIDNFQTNDKIKVFIGNTISAGVGITLTKATYVIFNSFDWVPGNNEQAEDRAYRLGQKNNVTVYYQLFEGTVSVRMWNTLQHKKDVISTIMGENDFNEEEIIGYMMEEILNEEDD